MQREADGSRSVVGLPGIPNFMVAGPFFSYSNSCVFCCFAIGLLIPFLRTGFVMEKDKLLNQLYDDLWCFDGFQDTPLLSFAFRWKCQTNSCHFTVDMISGHIKEMDRFTGMRSIHKIHILNRKCCTIK